jgi:hypothetical protein
VSCVGYQCNECFRLQVDKHTASQYKVFNDLSIHLASLELSIPELLVSPMDRTACSALVMLIGTLHACTSIAYLLTHR